MLSDLSSEFNFKAVRSGGKGGQHVNKVSTKIELYFSVTQSRILSDNQKKLLQTKLKHLLNEDGIIRITADTHRSQKQNKEEAVQKLQLLIVKALTPQKKRIKTRLPTSVKLKRGEEKMKRSDLKQQRKKPDLD